jgi:ceramide glucosyltransferase
MARAVVELILLILVMFAWGYWLTAWKCVRQLARRSESNQRRGTKAGLPTRRVGTAHLWDRGDEAVGDAHPTRSINTAHTRAAFPPVSILKPLKGAEDGLYENLATFCRQDFPEFEVICGVGDANDPAIEIVRRLQHDFPDRTIHLSVIDSAPGLNPKSAVLSRLVRRCHHEILVISDSDIRVEPDYLRRVVRPLDDPAIGLVTCAYRADPGAHPSFGGILGSLYINTTLLPGIAIADCIPGVHFALGATLALRRSDLLRAGGYEAISDELADDYRVGAMICDLGLKTHLSDCIVTHESDESSLMKMWNREIRWQRTIRAVEPRRYFGLGLTFGIPFAIALVCVAGGATWGWIILGATLLVRCISASAIARTIGAPISARQFVCQPLRDLLDTTLWLAAMFGSNVKWRGRSYRLLPNGKLQPIQAISVQSPRMAIRGFGLKGLCALIARLDRHLRARQNIFEYTEDPSCIFRARIGELAHHLQLQDGTQLAPGERVLELHFWNEHLPPLKSGDHPDLLWAVSARRQLLQSLVILARFLESRPDLNDIRAIGGSSLLGAQNIAQSMRLVTRIGFEFQDDPPERGLRGRLHHLGEILLTRLLIRAFNPGARKPSLASNQQTRVWMSRRVLMRRYLDRPAEEAANLASTRRGRRRHARAGAEQRWNRPIETRPNAPSRLANLDPDG